MHNASNGSPGNKDGLYWQDAQGNDPSPLGEFFAEATKQGYRAGGGGCLTTAITTRSSREGVAAPDGVIEYVVKGKMIGGFALVAYPAAYRNSGVMTFIVSHNGTVYQKDLGPHTAASGANGIL